MTLDTSNTERDALRVGEGVRLPSIIGQNLT